MPYSNTFTDRLKFVEFDNNSEEALRDFFDDLKLFLPGILERFYQHVSISPNLASMFKDQSRMNYAKSAQEQHWLKLFSAKFDEEYAQSVRRIGLVHSRIGLEPIWYIGAYAFILNHLYSKAAHQYKSRLSPEAAQDKTSVLLRALNQCAMIDMDMAISVYLEENKRKYDMQLDGLASKFQDSIGTIVQGVSSATTELEASASSLAQMADKTAANANNVAAASEKASENISAISSATEEISASISEVSAMATKSSAASQVAAEEADRSVRTMGELKQSIDKVNLITDLITRIAEQTNLLALNATIEAARAGEAGKGFSVVANEVKALATQTAKATEEIRNQIVDMLAKGEEVSESIATLKNIIGEVRNVVGSSADSVEQQKQAMAEIAQNIGHTSQGTHEISLSIVSISQAAKETGHSAEQVLRTVTDLASQSNNLKNAVSQFLQDIRSNEA